MKIDGIGQSRALLSSPPVQPRGAAGHSESPADSVELSDTARAISQVDRFLNLGSGPRVDLGSLDAGGKEEFTRMLGTLIRHGVVGLEVLDVNGRPETHFIETEIGDKRLDGAKEYRPKFPFE